jgi:TPR repeat protein
VLQQGNAIAQFQFRILLKGEQIVYANCLEQGVGCERDLLKTLHYFELAFPERVDGAEDALNNKSTPMIGLVY